MSAEFWSAIREQIAELRTATSADDVIRILGPDRNPYGTGRSGMDEVADGFFWGSGSDDPVDVALVFAGWRYLWGNAIHWAMRAPDGSAITYCEGDIYRGDRRPKGDN